MIRWELLKYNGNSSYVEVQDKMRAPESLPVAFINQMIPET